MTRPEGYRYGTLAGFVGHRFGPSSPVALPQSRIDAFAQATGDHQWIHVDRARAAAGPFGTTVAHGHLTLSLLSVALEEVGLLPPDATHVLNYGMDRVRFLAPVPEGSALASSFTLSEVRPKGAGQLLGIDAQTVLVDTQRPVLAAALLVLVLG